MLRVAEQRYAPGLRQAAHAHAEASVTIVLAGSLRETVGRADEVARPLSVVVKPGGTEHADVFGPDGARTLQIVLDEADAARVAQWERAARDWRWVHGGPMVPAFLLLLRAVRRRGEAGGAERVERAAWDVLAALAAAGGPPPTGAPPRWLALVREAVDASERPPRVRDLAASAGVHPVYLARCFRRHFGCTVSEYVQRLRVRRAAEAIAGSREPLSFVSYGAGFADQAHMCREFRAHTGVTPSDFRMLAG